MKLYTKLIDFIKTPAFRSAGIYTFSNFFAKATAFLLLFVYSNPKYLSVDENGLLNLLSSAIFVLMPFLAMGIVQSTNVDFFKLKKDDFKDFLTTSFVMPVTVMCLAFVGLWIFRYPLRSTYGFPFSFAFIIPVITFLNFFNELYIALIRNHDEPFTYFKAAMLRLFLEIGISIMLVVGFAWRWEGRVTGILVANITLFVVAIFYFKNKGYIFGRIRKKYLREELVYALPIIVMQCSTFCLSSSDKFFLSYFNSGDNKEVGIYGYACVFAAVISIGCSALLGYVMPKIYKSLSEPQVNYGQVRKYFNFYAGGSLLLLVGVIVFTPVLYHFFINHNYHPGLRYMFLIALGYFFWNIAFFFYTFLLYNKQKLKILALSVIAIFISLCSNYFFIRYWSSFGAALSVCISYFIILVITLLASYSKVRLMFSRQKISIISNE